MKPAPKPSTRCFQDISGKQLHPHLHRLFSRKNRPSGGRSETLTRQARPALYASAMHLQVVPAPLGENGELIKAYPMATASAILTRINIGLVLPPLRASS
jgi:hypothetical protein